MPPKLTKENLQFKELVEAKRAFERTRAADTDIQIEIKLKEGVPTLSIKYNGPDRDLFLHQTIRTFRQAGLKTSDAPRIRSITPPSSPICRLGEWPIVKAGKYKRSKSV